MYVESPSFQPGDVLPMIRALIHKMEAGNCPAGNEEKQTVSSPSAQQENTACDGPAVDEPDSQSQFSRAASYPESEDLDSFNLIEPPPLDWRSDDSSEAGSVEEMDDPSFPPSLVPVDSLEDRLSESLPPLYTSDTAASSLVVSQEELIDYAPEDNTPTKQVLDPSKEGGEVGDAMEEKVEIRRTGDKDHTRIHHLLNRLQVIGESPLHRDSTSDPTPPPSEFSEPSEFEPPGPSLLMDISPLLPDPEQNPKQASEMLFSESNQRDLLGLSECTEMGASQPSSSDIKVPPYMARRGEMDAVVSVSYNQEDGERFWEHFGNGWRLRHRDDSVESFPEDEVPEPVWMKLGEEVPEVDSAENSQRGAEDRPAYKDVPGPCDPNDLLDGVVFGAKYLGSTQLMSDKNPSTNARMKQAQEAVDRIKAPEGESQPMTEVDLFISTQRIKVLSAGTQEAMMDHPLQMISYIADIGSIVVLMARRKPAGGRKGQEGNPAGVNSPGPQKKCCMICHVFNSDEAQVIAQAIGQAFGVAYQQFLHANGIKASELRPSEYSDYLGTQEHYNGDLVHFSDSDNIREVSISKAPREIVGVAVVESGWGSILPTVMVANLLHGGPAERCGALSIGDRIMSVNGTSLVGLPITTCQSIIRDLKNQAEVKLSIVHCPPVTMAIIKRPDPKFQLGFSVEDGIICSLMRGGIAERGGIRVGHRIIEINGQSVVATPHEKIIHILTDAVGEIHLKTMPASTYRLLTGQETPVFL
ncbi:amyloid-beta A4 precursor protein-binding family A member 3-like isoform X1 [Oncorhynchus keta]|uniref:amyloid-beta A4 precursor protein-binding family A member 3-like isoform X1 n=2 Tax=Oncorhynchus keta TaxID=8018 RepID=UPI0015F92629|nr:amyloid-beta A4 precursor protein-binding family A member 3-like isoform X1 [Oncorhynchus keta]XP_052384323.1 amyloid-beta A4 precursor protein-binding family A member 3-like isoform X1 [Oncorhynchus keta]